MKIPITSIVFPFSESSDRRLRVGTPFASWEEAEAALAAVKGPTLGYYKTDFLITYADGATYGGRYDIGSDAPSLTLHIHGLAKRLRERGHEGEADSYATFIRDYQTA